MFRTWYNYLKNPPKFPNSQSQQKILIVGFMTAFPMHMFYTSIQVWPKYHTRTNHISTCHHRVSPIYHIGITKVVPSSGCDTVEYVMDVLEMPSYLTPEAPVCVG